MIMVKKTGVPREGRRLVYVSTQFPTLALLASRYSPVERGIGRTVHLQRGGRQVLRQGAY